VDFESDHGRLLEQWRADRSVLDVEITVGHVWMRFTGRVTYLCTTELVLAHEEGEISISLFCVGVKRIVPRAGSREEYWRKYRQVLQVLTDGGAVCMISERRCDYSRHARIEE